MAFLYDVTIKAHEKDYHKLKLVVNSLQYLNPQPKNTYIIEFMMYNKILLNKLFESYGSREAFIEKVYHNIDETKYPADQEIFGNLVCNYFNDKYLHVNNFPIIRTGYHYPQMIDEKQIEQALEQIKNTNREMYAISIHTWT